MHASEGRDSKIGLVTNFIVDLLMVLVIIAFLPGLRSLEIIPNDTDLLLGLIDHIRTEEWSLSGLRPI